MSRFKIGQRVVAVTNSFTWSKGDEFIVDGFDCCNHCGTNCIYLVGLNSIFIQGCANCLSLMPEHRESYREINFAPLQSFGEQIEESISKEAEEFATWAIEAIQTKP